MRSLTLGFGDLKIGDEWISPGRTIGRAEVSLFAGLSGDFNPLHVDHDWAATGPYGQPIAHGLLGLAIASGLASQAPRVATVAFIRVVEWSFLKPIFFDDTIRVVSRVVELEPKSRGRRGLVTWKRTVFNQHDVIVQQGQTQSLVRNLDEHDAPGPGTEQVQ